MIADALAWKLDRIKVEPVQPVKAVKAVESKDIRVKTGSVAGLRQKAKGILNDRDVIVLDFRAYIGAEEEYDAITISGVPSITQKIKPCIHGDIGTIAMIANAIPRVIDAPAGLVTMKDLPIPSATPEDLTKHITI
jgi:4-hydroxy-tetrahydrodipicolinate reductase